MCGYGYQRTLRIERMGRVPYAPMHQLQQARHAEVAAGRGDDTLFLLEHDPVITLGRNSDNDHVLLDREALAARGVALVVTERGGDVTYHGPGQIVGYPIVHLQEEERDIKAYVGWLEEIMIRTAADFGIETGHVEGLRGIWVGNDKLGAVGVRIAQWTTLHGFALNVSTDLQAFDMIVPCGLHGRGVTSFARLLGQAPTIAAVQARLADHAGMMLDRKIQHCRATPLPLATHTPRPRPAAQVQP